MPGPNQTIVQDAYGHFPPATGTALTAGAVGTSAAGTIATIAAGAGSAGTITAPNAIDMFGSFVLTPSATTPAAGPQALVTPLNSYPSVPRAIIATCYDAANAAALACAATSITASSFQISLGVAPTAAHLYTIAYTVLL